MQPDGNLVEYGGEAFNVMWNTRTYGNPGAYAVYQPDGNLVVYSANGNPLWYSGMRSGANRLVLQDDGHLVSYNSGQYPLWYTGAFSADYSVYAGSNERYPGSRLLQNQYIRSGDGRYSLRMQADGNLVVYGPGNHALWDSRTYGNPGSRFEVQWDGNMVIYNRYGTAIWWSGMKSSPRVLSMQSDGNLVQYDNWWRALWNSGTHNRT